LEAKILFDADKLDVSGALGIARTLLYQGNMSEPLYVVLPDGSVSNGENDEMPSLAPEKVSDGTLEVDPGNCAFVVL
jgi:uncharacterized protein